MNIRLVLPLALLLIGAAPAFAESLPVGSFAVVNGAAQSDELLKQWMANAEEQGAKPNADLRKFGVVELAKRAALAQEAQKQGLDKTPEAEAQVALLKQGYLIERLVAKYLEDHPVTDADLQMEYARQVNLLKDAKEYKLHGIVVSSEERAKEIITALHQGKSFDDLARDESLDASKTRGGDLGWMLDKQMNPLIANVVANMSKGSVVLSPIKIGSVWYVVRMDDERAFVPPTLESSKDKLRLGLRLRLRDVYIANVIGNAKIQLSD